MTDKAKGAYQLLVDLAEFDPKGARPGDWLNYHAALRELCRIVGEEVSAMIYNTGDPQGLRAAEANLRPIVTDLQRVVRQYATGKTGWTPITVNVGATERGLLAHGGTRDVAIFAAVMLLTKPDRPPIGICPEDDCGRLFVRVRRQQYCSRRCVNRANARDRRAKAKKTTTKRRKAR